jgi:hypothetical protein
VKLTKELKESAVLLNIPKGERVRAQGVGPKGYEPRDVIATDLAIYFATDAGPQRIPWQEIAKATWEQPWLTIITVQGEQTKIHLDPFGEMPPMVRDRVTASVVIRERVPLDIGGSVVCIGRREPLGDAISWVLEFDSEESAKDPEVRESADRALVELRSTLGI